ncbi:MAG: cytochrome b/b6 domain-containing protein [Mesorhizobium sp.]|nr:cytochrome b/b6 domain-containing protein [Mesorhizobium sp.]MCO5163184.1 cytochrome b/b6 domain-containing protein [Mesorhizobium sp.]
MAIPVRKGYSLLQIALHWLVAVLIAVQILYHEPMVGAWDAVRQGLAIPADLNLGVTVHVVAGVSVLLLVLLRLGVRIARGAPRVPENEPAPLKFVANATHILLYALMIAIPLGGLAAWAGGVKEAAQIHGLAANLLFALVLIHIAGALYQRFVLKTDVMTRMVVPEK